MFICLPIFFFRIILVMIQLFYPNGQFIEEPKAFLDAGIGGMPSRLPRELDEQGGEGLRSDNETFLPCYLAQLVRILEERMPGYNLMTTVIESHIKL